MTYLNKDSEWNRIPLDTEKEVIAVSVLFYRQKSLGFFAVFTAADTQ